MYEQMTGREAIKSYLVLAWLGVVASFFVEKTLKFITIFAMQTTFVECV